MEITSLKQLIDDCKAAFTKEFGEDPIIGATAPGRLNIIGEHVDYNDGFVLPMAIPLYTVIVGRANDKNTIRVTSLAEGADEPKTVEFDVPQENSRLSPGSPKWANYVKGVIEHFPFPVPGFDACIITTVPLGGGLSSSASLEVSMCTFLEILTGQTLEKTAKSLLCQKAEHTFAGMPCGIMDQFISCLGEEGSALLIDCRSLETRTIPLNSGDDWKELSFLIVNSNVKHELTGSKYPERRSDCFDAAKIIGVKSLREATLSTLREKRNDMGERVYRRALHVVGEIERCEKAAEAITDGNFEELGRLLYQSHVSLRDLHEVSCPELDQLVDITMQTKGVLGSRMTGGGFGGCIVALVKKSEANSIIKEVDWQYKGKATCYVFDAVSGAATLSLV